MKKDKELDQDTIALIEWCMQVEAQLIERGATREESLVVGGRTLLEVAFAWLLSHKPVSSVIAVP